MKKRFVKMTVIFGLAWALTGCQKEAAALETPKQETVTEADEGKEAAGQEADSQESVEQTEAQDTEQAQEADKSGAELPFIKMHTIYYEDGDSYEYATGSFERAEITGDALPKLTESVNSLFDGLEENFNTTMQDYVEDCKMQREEIGEDAISYYLDKSVNVYRLDGRVASFLLMEETYAGGAHGSYYMQGITFDSVTGEEIAFEDLGDIKDDVMEAIDNMVAEERENGASCLVYEDVRDELLDELEWYLDGRGLQIVLNTYSIASYAEGAFFVTIPYEDMPGFSDAYKPQDCAVSYMLDSYTENKGDFDSDGQEDVLEIIRDTDIYDNPVSALSYNGETVDLGYCGNFSGVYYLQGTDERNYIVFSYDEASDDYVTYLYELKDGKLLENPVFVGGRLESFIGDRIGVETYLYTFGTYPAYRSYRIENGAFVPVEERFEFWDGQSGAPERKIVLKAPIKVVLEQNGEMKEEELPIGTALFPLNSDDESVFGFCLEDGTYGELSFKREEGTIYIDGVPEYDIFEELPYAG